MFMVTEANSPAEEIHFNHEITEIFRYSQVSIQYTTLADCVSFTRYHKVGDLYPVDMVSPGSGGCMFRITVRWPQCLGKASTDGAFSLHPHVVTGRQLSESPLTMLFFLFMRILPMY